LGETKKVRSAGRFGSRYGVGIRKRIIKVEKFQKKKHACPECGFKSVKRIAAGIYQCTKCKIKFAGGAYIPETMSGSIVKKMVSQKSFVPHAKELLEAREHEFEEGVEKEKFEEKEKAVEKKEEKPVEKNKEKEVKKANEKEKPKKEKPKKKDKPKAKKAKKPAKKKAKKK